jgi:2C-methyl-D-erythritol 2,4-cyclodiphosphate synthase
MIDDRPLIAMEQGMELFNRYANSLNVVIFSKIKGIIAPDVLRKSLDLVQYRHPRLNSHIVGSLNNLHFKTEGTTKIPLNIVINYYPEYWQTVVNNELNKKIESEKKLIRATLILSKENINYNYLITTIHHAIIDAISGIYLHSDILSYVQHILNKKEVPKVQKLLAYPSLEEIISNYEINAKNLPKQTQQVDILPLEKDTPNEQRICRLIHRQLNTKLTQKIIKICKQKKITVQGAICAAMMLALANYLKKEEVDKEFYFNCRSSVDMRKRVNPHVKPENIAMLVSALTSFHFIKNNVDFWDLAKEVTTQIKARLKTSEIYNVILTYRQGTEYVLTHSDQVFFSVFVSNVGQVKIPSNYNKLELEEISYALSLKAMGSVFAVSVSTFQQKMTLNFIYSQPIISQSTINALVNSTMSILCCITS